MSVVFVCLWKNENSVLVAVKLTSGLYAPEEFWRLTFKKKDLLHPFQNCLGKENKRRWCADPISALHWELSKIILHRKQFSIKRILNKFEHSIAYENKKPCDAIARSFLIRGLFEVLRVGAGEKQERETSFGLESPTPVGTSHSMWRILLS